MAAEKDQAGTLSLLDMQFSPAPPRRLVWICLIIFIHWLESLSEALPAEPRPAGQPSVRICLDLMALGVFAYTDVGDGRRASGQTADAGEAR